MYTEENNSFEKTGHKDKTSYSSIQAVYKNWYILYRVQKQYFSRRVVDFWNLLSSKIIIETDSLDSFRAIRRKLLNQVS